MELTADIAGLVLDDKEQGIFRVHRSTFTDPTVFELEKKMIFDRSWLFAGHESEVKASGDFITRRVGGRPMIIVRGADDEVRVLLNTCRHRGNLVCRDASGHSDVLRCFYHGWVYGTNGELLGVPGADSYSDAFDMSALGLEPPGPIAVCGSKLRSGEVLFSPLDMYINLCIHIDIIIYIYINYIKNKYMYIYIYIYIYIYYE